MEKNQFPASNYESVNVSCLTAGSLRIRETLSSLRGEIPSAIHAEAARLTANAERGIADVYRQVA
jgi:hypothetical protein